MTSGLQFFDMGPSLIYLHGHKYHMKTQKDSLAAETWLHWTDFLHRAWRHSVILCG